MAHVFPEETVQKIYELAAIDKDRNKKLKDRDYKIFQDVCHDGFHYGFEGNLRTGQYVHYYHEKDDKHIYAYNCTTVIPSVYLNAEAFGFKPQIVQFAGYRDIKKGKDDKDRKDDAAHFALIVDVGKKNLFLVDPFFGTFGPILEHGEGYMRIGKTRYSVARKREYKEFRYYSVEDFAAMMERLRDPAESLEMLVAGQRVSRPIINSFHCDLKVFYDDENNAVKTRLFIDHTAITNKAIIYTQQLNDEGQTLETKLDLYMLKDITWAGLVDEKKVASIDLPTLQKLRRELRKIANIDKYQRISPSLLKTENRDRAASLLEIIAETSANMSGAELQRIRPQILARTLYEHQSSDSEYVYSHARHYSRLLSLRKQELKLNKRIGVLKEKLFLHGWKVIRLEKKEAQQIKRERERLEDQIRKEKIVLELNALNNLHFSRKHLYFRTMDMVVFAEHLKGLSVEELESEVAKKEFDTRIGYLAMVADFFPYVFKKREDLELKQYMSHIREKVKARREKKISRG